MKHEARTSCSRERLLKGDHDVNVPLLASRMGHERWLWWIGNKQENGCRRDDRSRAVGNGAAAFFSALVS